MIIHCEWTDAMTEKKQTSLLDALAECIGCSYLSELHDIKEEGRKKLIQKLEAISPEDYTPGNWNTALSYLITEPPSPQEEARRRRSIITVIKRKALFLKSPRRKPI